jgi:Zn-dependent protease
MLYNTRDEGALGMVAGLALLLALFGCLLLHELGHALMGRYFGIPTRDITLYPIGGVARLESMGERPIEEVCIALAGPAVNLILVALLLPVVVLAAVTGHLAGDAGPMFSLDQGWLGLAAKFALYLWAGNLTLLLFNLVPAFPMDGGRVLRAVLSFFMPRLQATEIAVPVGMLFALGFAVLAVLWASPVWLLIAFFVGIMGRLELQMLRRIEARRRAAAARAPAEAPPEPAPVPEPLRGFSGFTWDRDRRVWVRWFNGKPVDVA